MLEAEKNPAVSADLLRRFGLQLSSLLEIEQNSIGRSDLFLKHLREIIQRVENFRVGIMRLQTNEERINAMQNFSRMLQSMSLRDEKEEAGAYDKSGELLTALNKTLKYLISEADFGVGYEVSVLFA